MIFRKFYICIFCCLTVLFASCEKNHKKIAEKLLVSTRESECYDLIHSIAYESIQNKYYVWNGEKYELKVSGELENSLRSLIEFHKQNHSFINRKGEFDENKWDDWMYYSNHPEECEDLNSLSTHCILCMEKDSLDNKSDFDLLMAQISLEDFIYYSYFGETIKEKENSLTEIKKIELAEQAQIQWMENCSISMSGYIWSSTKTIKEVFKDLPASVSVDKKLKGKKLIVCASGKKDGDEIMSITAVFPCTKNGNRGSCYVSEIKVNVMGESVSAECYGGAYNDPEGAGRCLGLLNSGVEYLKSIK